MDSVSCSNNTFCLDLFRALSGTKPSENIFISPLSISSAMAMVYLGARGETATQMAKAMSFSSVQDVHAAFQTINSEINCASSSYTLKLANRLFGEQTLDFLPEFLDNTQKFYKADLKSVDFMGNPDQCRGEINSWVEQQTENKIKDLLQPGSITPMTRLALVNALYFKGDWMSSFKTCDTKEMPFKTNKNETKPVQMMYQMKKLPYNYIPELDLQILELPYKEQELSMFVLLPENSPEALQKLEEALTPEKLEEWTSKDIMDTSADVHVHLPKFKLEDQYELKEPLAKLGMSDVFCANTANLSGMNDRGGLFLSTVVHKTFVDVNEEGTEAAAATAGIISFCMFREEHFVADHPFFFVIRHNKTKSILFMGRFCSPE